MFGVHVNINNQIFGLKFSAGGGWELSQTRWMLMTNVITWCNWFRQSRTNLETVKNYRGHAESTNAPGPKTWEIGMAFQIVPCWIALTSGGVHKRSRWRKKPKIRNVGKCRGSKWVRHKGKIQNVERLIIHALAGGAVSKQSRMMQVNALFGMKSIFCQLHSGDCLEAILEWNVW